MSVSEKTEKKHSGLIPFKKGQSGNPKGRPKGVKNKLNEDFIKAIADDFKDNGIIAIQEVREKDPAAYLRVITSILPKEINGKFDHDHKHTHESVSDTDKWIGELLEGAAKGADQKPLPN